jgi:hypothetical protein
MRFEEIIQEIMSTMIDHFYKNMQGSYYIMNDLDLKYGVEPIKINKKIEMKALKKAFCFTKLFVKKYFNNRLEEFCLNYE